MVVTNSTTNYITQTLTGAVTVVNGANGNVVWNSPVNKSSIDVMSPNGVILPGMGIYSGYIYANPSIGDVNNDGSNDTFVSVSAYNYSIYGYLYNSTLELHRGSDGTLIWRNYYFDSIDAYDIYSMGDVNSDSIKDFLLSTHVGNRTDIRLLKGSDGTTQWNRSYKGYVGYDIVNKVTGAQKKDIIVTNSTGNNYTTITLLRAATVQCSGATHILITIIPGRMLIL